MKKLRSHFKRMKFKSSKSEQRKAKTNSKSKKRKSRCKRRKSVKKRFPVIIMCDQEVFMQEMRDLQKNIDIITRKMGVNNQISRDLVANYERVLKKLAGNR